MFVLDVLQHDVAEQVPSILRLLNNSDCIGWREFWPHDFTEDEVFVALKTLIDDGLVTIYNESPTNAELLESKVSAVDLSCESIWFGCSKQGKIIWDEWIPPGE
jgi:hypothetical protein